MIISKPKQDFAQKFTMPNSNIEYSMFSKASQPRFENVISIKNGECLYREMLFPTHPTGSAGSVQDFFLDAEKTGLVQWLDEAMLNYAVDQILHGEISDAIGVNMSYLTINLAWARLARKITRLPHIVRSKLCIELTETPFYTVDLSAIESFLGSIKESGVAIALDDFGSGFHETLPPFFHDHFMPDIVKIDYSLLDDPSAHGRLGRICEFFNEREVIIVGERVNEANIGILEAHNIVFAQGWGIEQLVANRAHYPTHNLNGNWTHFD